MSSISPIFGGDGNSSYGNGDQFVVKSLDNSYITNYSTLYENYLRNVHFTLGNQDYGPYGQNNYYGGAKQVKQPNCSDGYTGVIVSQSVPGTGNNRLEDLQLICADKSNSGITNGNNGNTLGSFNCPPGQVLSNVTGRHNTGWNIGNIQFTCNYKKDCSNSANAFDPACSQLDTSSLNALKLVNCSNTSNISLHDCKTWCLGPDNPNPGSCDSAATAYCDANQNDHDFCGCFSKNFLNTVPNDLKPDPYFKNLAPICVSGDCKTNGYITQSMNDTKSTCPSTNNEFFSDTSR
jgi:hypothetical protein